jgi:hypothetical protein
METHPYSPTELEQLYYELEVINRCSIKEAHRINLIYLSCSIVKLLEFIEACFGKIKVDFSIYQANIRLKQSHMFVGYSKR